MERERINLRTLFVVPYDDLPDIVDSQNCIYRIINRINNKSYIGQAKYLYGRFIENGFSHKSAIRSCKSYIYNAIRKYKSRNFEVEILEKNLDIENLNDREIYWIAYYDTYYIKGKGYNLTSGGDNCEHLHTPEVRKRAFETQLEIYDGVLACQTPKAYETNRRNHGGVLAWNTEKALETNRRNHGGVLAWNTEEALENQRRNHNGVLAFHTEEARIKSRETQYKKYGSLAFHTKEAKENCNISKWFYISSYNLEKALIDYEEINGYTYFMSSSWEHLDRIIKDYDILQDDDRWTPEHERIYQELLKVPGMIKRYKL